MTERYRCFLIWLSEMTDLTSVTGRHVISKAIVTFNETIEDISTSLVPIMALAPSAINAYLILTHEVEWYWLSALTACLTIELASLSFAGLTIRTILDGRATDLERYGSVTLSSLYYLSIFAFIISLKGWSIHSLVWPFIGVLAAIFYAYSRWLEKNRADDTAMRAQTNNSEEAKLVRFIQKDPEATYAIIKEQLGVSDSRIRSITRSAGYAKVSGRWTQDSD